ncbi:sugar ABC transporter permease [Arthrobacter sp. BHU FT2]|uniref:ABC transporter permease n=1 Tax=Pseudarthrobacter enclensis TaxID=993070 RepID=A0A0V8IMR7_9MICC|nr:sugar ABC transporter permease [Pseudarthrobacter enclensis]KSU75840.1 ABC transporter permease [Pseudarthrobacter enclensis]MBT2250574.1 sugar ABC transporter permease [Arthrobacter sp. BHU FT2]SCC07432.1 carbohydrate ABC transporter membrane protein 1, CUT1 family [Pseudarthrobacter enclensis]
MSVLTKQAPGAAATIAAGPPGRRKQGSPRRRNQRSGYLFLLPWFLGMLFTIVPFFASLYLAFTDYNLFTEPNFVGLANFQAMAEDPRLGQSLKVTFIYTFVSVPISLAVALLIALVLNRGLQGLAIYRSVYYLPSLLGGSVAIVMLWRYIFGNEGIINGFLGLFGIAGPAWVTDPNFSLSTLIVLNVWTFGSPMVIFLAGLRQVPTMYYEAASIDGASRWRQFRSITIPLISPIIFFNLIMQLIGSFQTFTQGYVMSGGTGGPADSTLFYNLYLYQKGFTEFEMGYASAMAWLLLMIIAIFTAINFIASKFWVFYDN